MLTTSVIIDFDTVMRVGANQLEFDFFFQASFNGTTYVLDEYSFINSLRVSYRGNGNLDQCMYMKMK